MSVYPPGWAPDEPAAPLPEHNGAIFKQGVLTEIFVHGRWVNLTDAGFFAAAPHVHQYAAMQDKQAADRARLDMAEAILPGLKALDLPEWVDRVNLAKQGFSLKEIKRLAEAGPRTVAIAEAFPQDVWKHIETQRAQRFLTPKPSTRRSVDYDPPPAPKAPRAARKLKSLAHRRAR